MKEWDTALELPVATDGSVELVGFFGEYAVTQGGETCCFTLTPAARDYTVTTAARSSAKPGRVAAAAPLGVADAASRTPPRAGPRGLSRRAPRYAVRCAPTWVRPQTSDFG